MDLPCRELGGGGGLLLFFVLSWAEVLESETFS